MELRKLTANARQELKKGAVRRLRASGKIPAVAYGKQLEPRSLSVSPTEVEAILHSDLGRNTVIELDVDGKDKLTVLLNQYQYHPVSRHLLHADFYQISMKDQLRIEVPFELVGRAKDVVMGGPLRQVLRKLPVRCLPEHIPVKITYNVTELDLEQHVHVEELELPEGVTVDLPPKQTVAGLITEKRRGQDAEEETAAVEGDKEKPAEKK